MNKQFSVWFGLLLTLFFVGWGAVHATVVKAFEFDGLCETATTIMYVKCTARDHVQFPDRDGIFTQTRFDTPASFFSFRKRTPRFSSEL